MLSVYGHMRAPSHHPTFLSNCAARFLTKVVCASCIVPGCCAQVALCKLLHAAARKCSVQVALRKCSEQVALRQLLRASALRMCSVQFGLCKLLCASCSVQALCACALCKFVCASCCALCNCSVQVALRKLLCASDSAQVALHKCCRSCGNVLRILFVYLKVAIFQPELQEYGPRATLRFSSRSCGGVLRVLRLYLKVAIFQPELREHAPHTTSVLKSCDFPAGAAGARSAYYATFVLKSCDFKPELPRTRGESNPRPRECESRRANHETSSKRPFREQEYCTAPQRERFDTPNLRRGVAETKTNSHGATARALRRERSPQRVARGPQKS